MLGRHARFTAEVTCRSKRLDLLQNFQFQRLAFADIESLGHHLVVNHLGLVDHLVKVQRVIWLAQKH